MLSAVAIATGITLVTATAAYAATTSTWYFAGVTVGAPVPDGKVFADTTGTTDLHAANDADGTTLEGVNLDMSGHMKSIYFPGWQGVPANGNVDEEASMLSSDPTFETSGVGSDGASNVHDPQGQDFSVSVWIRPDDPADFALAGTGYRSVSPNIVQKGLSGTPGGFWKLSLNLDLVAGNRVWQPFCQFQYRNGTQAVNLSPGLASGHRFNLLPATAYKISCVRDGRDVTLNVSTGAGAVFTDTSTAPVDFTIANDKALSVGHKPGSTDPKDVYSGALDNLVTTKG